MEHEALKALSIRQPWAELILRGEKTVEYRSQITKIRQRVYIYAALGKPEGPLNQTLTGIGMSWDELPKGVLVGTVEITGCEATDDGYEWHLSNPQRLDTPLKPENQPQPVWFNPFDAVRSNGKPEDEPADVPSQVSSPMLQIGGTLKVLSLFFVDKVANYRVYNDDGQRQNGIFANWFEEAYRKYSDFPMYKGLIPFDAVEVHDGYFSEDKKKGKVVGLKDTTGSTKADDDTYHTIMRDKERLLSAEEPLRFIFSHSALREGWDNPNVFQICTLREMGTDRERRQTLGRGLRLPVRADGNRVFDDSINRLTVIANESFEEYAKGLQADIEKDLGDGFKFGRVDKIAFARVLDPTTEEPIGQDRSKEVWKTLLDAGYIDDKGDITDKFTPEKKGFVMDVPPELQPMRPAIVDEMKRYIFKNRIVNARDRRSLNYNKRVELSADFKALWDKINQKTRYRVEFSTLDLIERATAKIKRMETIHPVQILIDKTELNLTEAGVEGGKVRDSKSSYVSEVRFLPDILAFLQRETELTRGTLVEILKQSGRLDEFKINPQAFMTEVAKLITRTMNELVIDGIKYERLEGQSYEMRLFEEKEIEEYLSRLYTVQSTDDRTPYDFVPFDSEVERDVAEKLDSAESVKFFCKLPGWFKIPTPLGDYNPDWAVVLERDKKLYLVRETKDTHDRDKRRDTENKKIDCGRAHFDAIGVDYAIATNIQEVLTPRTK